MVSGLSIAFMGVTALIAFGVPVVLFLGLRKRFGLKIVPLLVGAAVFIVFALVLEQIMHALVLRPGADGSIALRTAQPVLYVLYAAFAAGIFEETGRLTGFLILKKKYAGVRTAISYGIGHGGIEAWLLAGLSAVSSIALGLMVNAGVALPASADSTVEALKTTAPALFLVGGIERLSAIALHLALSVFVWVAVTRRARWWLFPLAIVLHAAADVSAATYQVGGIPLWAVEVVTAAFAVVLLVVAIRMVRGCLAEERTAAEDATAEQLSEEPAEAEAP